MLYTALIIEFRKHKALAFVLKTFCENLSQDWSFLIFHGNLNKEYIQQIIDTELISYKERITMIHLPHDNLLPYQYSSLLINETVVYDNIPTETFLIFQTDSIIIKKNKEFINEFLKYDYVGAPWGVGGCEMVGNGGLSLRKKSKMLEIIEKENIGRRELPEDLFFAQATNVQLYKPEWYEASKFSIENCEGCGDPFGFHQPWNFLYNFCEIFPEVNELFLLQ